MLAVLKACIEEMNANAEQMMKFAIDTDNEMVVSDLLSLFSLSPWMCAPKHFLNFVCSYFVYF